MRTILALLLLLTAACTENFNFLGTGDNGSSIPDSAITTLTIEPSQFELSNGDQVTAEVRAFVGSFEVQDFAFTVSITPNQSVATVLGTSGRVIRFKAENPGFTNLVVTVRPGVSVTAPIRVVAAT